MMPLVGEIAKRIEFPVLLAAITIAGGLFGFIEMMEVARATEPHAFDTAILLFFREAGNPAVPIGPVWFADAVRDLTSLGSASVLIFITAATSSTLSSPAGRRRPCSSSCRSPAGSC